MLKFKPLFIVLNLALVLGYFTWATFNKENILHQGKTVYVALAPVDPRSLMQGDYMRLRYSISDTISHVYGYNDTIKLPKRGYLQLAIDQRGVAEFDSVLTMAKQVGPNKAIVNYTAPSSWDVNIGAESYFFQEGQSSLFDSARYGVLKIDGHGHSVLVGLADRHLKVINP